MRRPIHMNGGAFDLSQMGIPQQQSLARLAHPALLSNLGVHNVLQGVSNPLHSNMLRSTGGDLIDDLYQTGRHLLGVGLRGGDFLDTLFGLGRNLLGLGLYAQPHPHGGDLIDDLYQTGRHLLGVGLDGHDLNEELHKHGRRLHGGSFFDTLGRVGEAVLPHLADAGIHYLLSGGSIPAPHSRSPVTSGGSIPAPHSRSPVTDPSMGGRLQGGDFFDFLQGTRKALHSIGTPFQAISGVNPADLGEDISKAILGDKYVPVGKGLGGNIVSDLTSHRKITKNGVEALTNRQRIRHQMLMGRLRGNLHRPEYNTLGLTPEQVEHIIHLHHTQGPFGDPGHQITNLGDNNFDPADPDLGTQGGVGLKKPRKGRFVKGSAEAKAYMASIRKKK